MSRRAEIILAAMLILAAAGLFLAFNHGVAVFAAWLVLGVLRRGGWRIIVAFTGFTILPFIPFLLRHWFGRTSGAFTRGSERAVRRLWAGWCRLPLLARWPLAVALVIPVAAAFLIEGLFVLAAGGTLGALAFLSPFRVGRLPIVGPWLQRQCLPLLARTATAQELERIFAPILPHLLPPRLREEIHRRYRRLWWTTTRRLVRERQLLGRSAARRLRHPVVALQRNATEISR